MNMSWDGVLAGVVRENSRGYEWTRMVERLNRIFSTPVYATLF